MTGGEESAEALATLEEHRADFVDFLRRRTHSGADAEDLLDEAFATASRTIVQLHDLELVLPWFYRVLRRTLADHHARWALREDKLGVLRRDVDEATHEEAATCACSLGLIETLPAPYAEVLQRVDLEEQELAQVAGHLGTTRTAMAVRLHRARRALRERLLTFCGRVWGRPAAASAPRWS